jgi:hypothetical protein
MRSPEHVNFNDSGAGPGIVRARFADGARQRRDPFAEGDAATGLSCRLYRTEHGVSGSPSVEQLMQVLR